MATDRLFWCFLPHAAVLASTEGLASLSLGMFLRGEAARKREKSERLSEDTVARRLPFASRNYDCSERLQGVLNGYNVPLLRPPSGTSSACFRFGRRLVLPCKEAKRTHVFCRRRACCGNSLWALCTAKNAEPRCAERSAAPDMTR